MLGPICRLKDSSHIIVSGIARALLLLVRSWEGMLSGPGAEFGLRFFAANEMSALDILKH